ncbi:MAG: redoxin domain-containing protein [Planctomycetota bacterium]|jgi:peroxiredoxin|nr:redoxin domain-containing protein [Planctomycetota bacterium]
MYQSSTRFTSLLVALLLSSTLFPCSGQTATVGTKAPNFTGARTFHDDGRKSFADHEGEVVLLVFFCTICRTQWIQKPIQKLQDRYADQGLTVIGLLAGLEVINEETTEEARQYSKDMTFKVWFGADLSDPNMVEPFNAFRPSTRPQCMLIGSDGRVAWVGKPGSVDVPATTLERILKERLRRIVDAHPSASDEIRKSVRSGKIAKAYTQAQNEQLQPLANTLSDSTRKSLQRADQLHQNRQYLQAHDIYQKVSRSWKGTDLGEQAESHLKKYRSSPLRKEVSLLKNLNTLLLRLGSDNPTRAFKTLKAFARKYPNTEAGKRAQQLAKQLQMPNHRR